MHEVAKVLESHYDIQIAYDYTVEVTNRFRGLDLVDRVAEELWTEVCNIVQEAKPSQRKRIARRQMIV